MADDFIKIANKDGMPALIPFKSLVALVNEGIFCVDSEGTIVFVNKQFCHNLGYSESELLGTSIFTYLYDQKSAQLSHEKFEMRKRGISDVYDLRMKRKNGEAMWSRVSGKPLFDSQGKFIASITIHADITKQKELEEELMLAKEDLETKVITRTRELSEVNQRLKVEIKERKLAEVSLKSSEKRFRDIFINSPDAIYVESPDGKILDVNEAACRLHGIDRSAIVGKTIYDFAPKSEWSAITNRRSKIERGEIKKFETESTTVNGTKVPVEISVSSIDYQGKPALLLFVRDISDRNAKQMLQQQLHQELEEKVALRTKELQQANERLQQEIAEKEKYEKELQDQKNFFRSVIDSTPNMIYVKNSAGQFLLANRSTAEFYNTTPEMMEGQQNTTNQFSQEVLDMLQEQDRQVLAANHAIQFPEQQIKSPHTGETRWLTTTKMPIPSTTDEGTNILGVSVDITEVKEAQERLSGSEQLYREVARNLPKTAMFIFDKDLRYILAEGPLVGIISKPKSEIEGKAIKDTIRESEQERVEAVYRKILEGETNETEQSFFGRSLRVHHIPIRNEKGEIINGMVLILDISDLKTTQRELEKRASELQRSNEELERFAYVASHDLQSPLRTIASYLQLLKMRYEDSLNEEALEFINFSVNGAKRMQIIIQELLSYSRISTIQKPFTKANLNEVLSEVLKNLESNIKAANADVVIDQLPVLYCEPNQLQLLFQNLIDNAIKFVKNKKPVVKISVRELENAWEFSVADNGIGIKEEFKEKVFQIFQRLHSQSEFPGTGVGLAICKKVVELHGGRIWIDSEENVGTTFHFTLAKHAELEKQILDEPSAP